MIEKQHNMKPYSNLLIMQGISFVIMYAVMFMNVSSIDHIYLSITRTYMTLLMITPMALMMLIFMNKMYKNVKLNMIVSVLSISIFVFSFLGLRLQWFISDDQYMKAMIPHHSSAILTSEQANIFEPEVKKLSEEIIEAQIKEITEMENLLHR
jgi:hypothetical protein